MTDQIRLGNAVLTRVAETQVQIPTTLWPSTPPEAWHAEAELLAPRFWNPETDLFRIAIQSWVLQVDGHTDDKPVKNARFPSNWELSLARAGRVARFLIDTTGLPPTQFGVTGYSYFRPLRPNTSDDNRKINRRVEIVLSKELPQVEATPPANLQ